MWWAKNWFAGWRFAHLPRSFWGCEGPEKRTRLHWYAALASLDAPTTQWQKLLQFHVSNSKTGHAWPCETRGEWWLKSSWPRNRWHHTVYSTLPISPSTQHWMSALIVRADAKWLYQWSRHRKLLLCERMERKSQSSLFPTLSIMSFLLIMPYHILSSCVYCVQSWDDCLSMSW